ncbi:restriction endonuclease subunit S, partial [uncultured Treponema sp.]|uniref:restriction endonuclease subunit S n=1 Tax=uncultured Treponema sp. TaxID=162155 RepID=UPI002594E05F
MSKLYELIKELCPNGVEYKTLGEVCEYEQPGKYIVNSTDYNDDFEIPVLTAGQSFILGYTDESNGIYNASKESPVIIFDDFTAAFKWVDFPFKVKSSAMKILKTNEKALLRYVFHCMGNLNFSSTEHKRLWIATYSNFQIPVPPLPVQEEIVRILDKFTSYGDCLNKELSLRKKQYEWTRQKLLEIKKTPVVQIKDVCRIEKGKTPIQKAVPGGYPLVVTTDERKTCSTYQFDCKAVCLSLVSARGHGVAQISRIFYQEGKFALGNILCAIIPNNENQLSAKFLRHYLFYKKDSLLVPLMKGGANVALHVSDLEKVKFPLPPLDIQQRIVNVLDNFDAICSDLKIGLPAEIDARKKQYEYYRDLLLTFAERGNTIFADSRQQTADSRQQTADSRQQT